MVTKRFAETERDSHGRLVNALLEAAVWCDEPQNRERLAEFLSGAAYLNLPVRVIAPALLGKFDCGNGRIESVPDFHVFHRGDASVPKLDRAEAQQRALVAAGLLPAAAAQDNELPRRLFREDLHREIINQHHHLNEIAKTSDLRGVAH
jgi:ABC-type nitrate/sulfonate/bicarbonate transport system substrate-binding protein